MSHPAANCLSCETDKIVIPLLHKDLKKLITRKHDSGSSAEVGSSTTSMKQKLAIISALLHEPKLILMDEPFVGLDPLAAHQLKTLMRRFCDGGGAIFFSTHVLEVAEKLCDRVAIVRAGRLVRAGSMDEVRGDDSLEEVFLELEGTEAQA